MPELLRTTTNVAAALAAAVVSAPAAAAASDCYEAPEGWSSVLFSLSDGASTAKQALFAFVFDPEHYRKTVEEVRAKVLEECADKGLKLANITMDAVDCWQYPSGFFEPRPCFEDGQIFQAALVTSPGIGDSGWPQGGNETRNCIVDAVEPDCGNEFWDDWSAVVKVFFVIGVALGTPLALGLVLGPLYCMVDECRKRMSGGYEGVDSNADNSDDDTRSVMIELNEDAVGDDDPEATASSDTDPDSDSEPSVVHLDKP